MIIKRKKMNLTEFMWYQHKDPLRKIKNNSMILKRIVST